MNRKLSSKIESSRKSEDLQKGNVSSSTEGKPAVHKRRSRTKNQTGEVINYREILNGMNDTAWIIDFDASILDVNDAATRVLGYSREELIAMKIPDIDLSLTPDQISGLIDNIEKVIVQVFETSHRTKDGRQIPVEISSSLVSYRGRDVILSIARNITRRKQAEQQLQAREQVLKQFVEYAPAAIAMFDRNMNYIAVSRRFIKDYRLEKENIIGLSHYDVFPELSEKIKNIHKRCLEGASEQQDEDPFPRADGTLDWVRWEIIPWLDSDEKIGGLLLFSEVITERKRTGEKIRESEEKFRKAFETSPDSINIIRADTGEYVAINGGFTKMTGFSAEDIIGKTSLDAGIWVNQDDRRRFFEDLTTKGLVDNMDARFRSSDGRIIHGLISASYLTFDNIPHIISVTRDITDRKEAEEKLLASEEKYKCLIESLDNVVAMIDGTGSFLYINRVAAGIMELATEDIIGKTVYDLFPKTEVDILMVNVNRSLRENKATTYEHVSTIEGKLNWFRTTILPVYDATIKETHALINSVDINNIKQVQQELIDLNLTLEEKVIERSAQVQDLYDKAPIGYHSLDADGYFISINQTELDWLGYSRGELTGKHVKTIVEPGSFGIFEINFPVLKAKGKLEGLEFTVLCKNGRTFTAEVNATAIFDQEGNFIGTRSSLLDISLRKKAEEAMNKAIIEAFTANRSKSDFLANMSHEIRTPMNAILGYSELLGSIIKEGAAAEYIESIKTSGRSLLALINDILDLSKIEAGKLELELTDIETVSFFSDFERIFGFRTKDKGIGFLTEIEGEIPSYISVDETRLRQILLNLVGNAVKFTEFGYVKLKVIFSNRRRVNYSETNEGEIIDLRIDVEDSGIGIPEESLDDIFDSFVQVRTRLAKEGTGLGLPISNRLAGLMNGKLTVRSEQGKGSTFTLIINGVTIQNNPLNAAAKNTINTDAIIFKKALILIVDDIETNRKFFSDALQASGLDLIVAGSGAAALEIMKYNRPDLVISDIRMPEMDGYEFLNLIKADNRLKTIPVIAYSASAMKEQRDRISRSDFAGLLIKPVMIKDIYAELIRFLPYHLKQEEADTGKNEVTLLTEEITDPKGLLKTLEGKFLEKLKAFENRQPIGEVKKFGESLIELGKRHNCQIITIYGSKLVLATDRLDITMILKLLKQYNENLDTLKTIFRKQ